jgi:hypothetical protein
MAGDAGEAVLEFMPVHSKRLANVPMPSMDTSTVLPGFIEPTPTEVPQQITSPG